MEIIEVLKSNDYVWLAINISTLVSVPLAIYFGCKSLAGKTICTVISNNELITNKQSAISKLKILYDNKDVDKLTVTKLTFWNNSHPTIKKDDIVDDTPLSIISNNGTILEVSVLNGENTSNKINAFLVNDTTANFTFKYLNKKEGGIIQIIHTGSKNSIAITGKIMGGQVKIKEPPYELYGFVLMGISMGLTTLHSVMDFLPVIEPWILTIIYLLFLRKLSPKDYIPQNCRENTKKDTNLD